MFIPVICCEEQQSNMGFFGKLLVTAVADPGGGGGVDCPPPNTPTLYLLPSPFLPAALICWTAPYENPGSVPEQHNIMTFLDRTSSFNVLT